MRRLGLLAVALMLAGSPVVSQARGHGSHSSGSRSYGSHSSGSRSYGSSHSKPVHMGGHYTKHGTYVRPHSRAMAGTATHTKSTGASYRRRSSSSGYGTAQRDSHGKIKRNPAAKAAFRHSHPCPSTGRSTGACPGYVVDHVRALKHGGSDSPDNMQWQTRSAAKAKDRWE